MKGKNQTKNQTNASSKTPANNPNNNKTPASSERKTRSTRVGREQFSKLSGSARYVADIYTEGNGFTNQSVEGASSSLTERPLTRNDFLTTPQSLDKTSKREVPLLSLEQIQKIAQTDPKKRKTQEAEKVKPNETRSYMLEQNRSPRGEIPHKKDAQMFASSPRPTVDGYYSSLTESDKGKIKNNVKDFISKIAEKLVTEISAESDLHKTDQLVRELINNSFNGTLSLGDNFYLGVIKKLINDSKHHTSSLDLAILIGKWVEDHGSNKTHSYRSKNYITISPDTGNSGWTFYSDFQGNFLKSDKNDYDTKRLEKLRESFENSLKQRLEEEGHPTDFQAMKHKFAPLVNVYFFKELEKIKAQEKREIEALHEQITKEVNDIHVFQEIERKALNEIKDSLLQNKIFTDRTSSIPVTHRDQLKNIINGTFSNNTFLGAVIEDHQGKKEAFKKIINFLKELKAEVGNKVLEIEMKNRLEEERKRELIEKMEAEQEVYNELEEGLVNKIKDLFGQIGEKVLSSEKAEKAFIESLKNLDSSQIVFGLTPEVTKQIKKIVNAGHKTINKSVEIIVKNANSIGETAGKLYGKTDRDGILKAERNAKTNFYDNIIKYQNLVLESAVQAKDKADNFVVFEREAQDSLKGYIENFKALIEFNSEASIYRQNGKNVHDFCIKTLETENDSDAKELLKSVSVDLKKYILSKSPNLEELFDKAKPIQEQIELFKSVKTLAGKLSTSLLQELEQVYKIKEDRQLVLQRLQSEAVASLEEVKRKAFEKGETGLNSAEIITKTFTENTRSDPNNASPKKISGKRSIPALFTKIIAANSDVSSEFQTQTKDFISEKRKISNRSSNYDLEKEFAEEVIRVSLTVNKALDNAQSASVISKNIISSAIKIVSDSEKQKQNELAKEQEKLRNQIIEKSKEIFTTLQKLKEEPYVVDNRERILLVSDAPMIEGRDQERLLMSSGERVMRFSENEIFTLLNQSVEKNSPLEEGFLKNKIKESERVASTGAIAGEKPAKEGANDFLKSLNVRCDDVNSALNKKVTELDNQRADKLKQEKMKADLETFQALQHEERIKAEKEKLITRLASYCLKIYAKKSELDDLIGFDLKGQKQDSPTKRSQKNNPDHWKILGEESGENNLTKNLVINFYKNAPTFLNDVENQYQFSKDFLMEKLQDFEIVNEAEFEEKANIAEAKLEAAINLEKLRRVFKDLKQEPYLRTQVQIQDIYTDNLSKKEFKPIFDELIKKESLEKYGDDGVENNLNKCLSKATPFQTDSELSQMQGLSQEARNLINILPKVALTIRNTELEQLQAKRNEELLAQQREREGQEEAARKSAISNYVNEIIKTSVSTRNSVSKDHKLYIDRIELFENVNEGDKKYYQPILKQEGSNAEICDRKYGFRVQGELILKNGSKIKDFFNKKVDEAINYSQTKLGENYKLTDQEIAVAILLASKHNGFREEANVKEDLKAVYPDKEAQEIENIYIKMHNFSQYFQEKMLGNKIVTARDKTDSKYTESGFRLAGLTPNYAFAKYAGSNLEDGLQNFNKLCGVLKLNYFNQSVLIDYEISDSDESRPNSAEKRLHTPDSSSKESLAQSYLSNIPSSSPKAPLSVRSRSNSISSQKL